MREGKVAEPLDRQDAGDRLSHQREHLAQSGVEEQRLIINYEVLVEGEPAAAFEYNRRIDAIYPRITSYNVCYTKLLRCCSVTASRALVSRKSACSAAR